MSGRIFVLLSGGQLAPLEEAPYELEDILQELLGNYPDLLAGELIDEASPRRWLLVTREVGVPDDASSPDRWAADHLFLDQDGIPTIVEVKRSSDTRLRREVVGQILDYAANAVVYWPPDSLRLRFEAACEAQGRDPTAAIVEFLELGDEIDGVARFWDQVRTNLQAERIRLILVADEIPRETRRIIEFLNEQMDPAEFLGVQIRQYVGDDLRTLVPQVVGQTAEAETRRSTQRATRTWDGESFDRALAEARGAAEARVAQRIREWATDRRMPIEWGRGVATGSFSVRVQHGGVQFHTFSVNTRGDVGVGFGWMASRSPFDDPQMRRQLLERLNSVTGVELPADKLDAWPSFPLRTLLDEDALVSFLATWEWYAEQVDQD